MGKENWKEMNIVSKPNNKPTIVHIGQKEEDGSVTHLETVEIPADGGSVDLKTSYRGNLVVGVEYEKDSNKSSVILGIP